LGLEIQYRVNEDGTLNLRLFNREKILIILDKGLAIPRVMVYMKWIFTFKELVTRYLNIN
jgi:hypothetical protein